MKACRSAVGDVAGWVRRQAAGEAPAISGLMEDPATSLRKLEPPAAAEGGRSELVTRLTHDHAAHAMELAEDVEYLRTKLIDHYADALVNDQSDKCAVQ